MLTPVEQEQLLAANQMIGDYVRRILETVPAPIKVENTE